MASRLRVELSILSVSSETLEIDELNTMLEQCIQFCDDLLALKTVSPSVDFLSGT